jgi:hypothetical protein
MSMRWVPLVVATVLLGAALLIVWLVAVPVGPVACPAIYPAPRNCTGPGRSGTAVVVTAVVAAIYAMTALLALLGRRSRRPLVIAGVVALAAASPIGYAVVIWAA